MSTQQWVVGEDVPFASKVTVFCLSGYPWRIMMTAPNVGRKGAKKGWEVVSFADTRSGWSQSNNKSSSKASWDLRLRRRRTDQKRKFGKWRTCRASDPRQCPSFVSTTTYIFLPLLLYSDCLMTIELLLSRVPNVTNQWKFYWRRLMGKLAGVPECFMKHNLSQQLVLCLVVLFLMNSHVDTNFQFICGLIN